jgi:3-mercaptopyruvate sulfurtransferase SseA
MKSLMKVLLAAIAVAITVGYLWQANRVVVPPQATWEDVQAEATSGGYRIITTEELAKQYASKPSEMLLVDTRQAWEYRTGHIAGALNFPMEPTRWARWRKAGALQKFLGPDKDRTIVFY